MSIVYLSHFLSPDTPFYGSDGEFQVEALRSIKAGDSCNANYWSFPNHAGTHIDLPLHFSQDGKCLNDYLAEFWLFHNVSVIDISGRIPGSVINANMFKNHRISESTELLLLKTGFGSLRGTSAYWQAGPVFSPYLADYFRTSFPNLRIFGFDAISVSSWSDRVTGREAHRAFLGGARPILLLEDMNLLPINGQQQIAHVTVAPLLVSGADASPCAVIAKMVTV